MIIEILHLNISPNLCIVFFFFFLASLLGKSLPSMCVIKCTTCFSFISLLHFPHDYTLLHLQTPNTFFPLHLSLSLLVLSCSFFDCIPATQLISCLHFVSVSVAAPWPSSDWLTDWHTHTEQGRKDFSGVFWPPSYWKYPTSVFLYLLTLQDPRHHLDKSFYFLTCWFITPSTELHSPIQHKHSFSVLPVIEFHYLQCKSLRSLRVKWRAQKRQLAWWMSCVSISQMLSQKWLKVHVVRL